MTRVRGYVLTRYGAADAMQLRDVPLPIAGAGEVLIATCAAGLNPVDYKMRDGGTRLVFRVKLPAVAGGEVAGVIDAVGPGVTRFAPGDRVFARVDKVKLGAFAEYVAVDQDFVATMPDSLDFVQAAGVPLAGLTALQALRDELGVQQGEKVFIAGGAGGVGTFAVQLAKWLGAYVATTASPRGAELVRRLGADLVVDYTRDNVRDLLHDYDAALDLVGGQSLADALAVVRPGGRLVSIAGPPEPLTARKDLAAGRVLAAMFWLVSIRIRGQARKRGVSYRYMFMHPSGEDLATLARLIDEQRVEVVTDRVFGFEQIADAFEYLEQGHAKGKVVVRMTA